MATGARNISTEAGRGIESARHVRTAVAAEGGGIVLGRARERKRHDRLGATCKRALIVQPEAVVRADGIVPSTFGCATFTHELRRAPLRTSRERTFETVAGGRDCGGWANCGATWGASQCSLVGEKCCSREARHRLQQVDSPRLAPPSQELLRLPHGAVCYTQCHARNRRAFRMPLPRSAPPTLVLAYSHSRASGATGSHLASARQTHAGPSLQSV